MSDIIDMFEYKTVEELKAYASASFLALKSAAEKINDLQLKITHLEDLLKCNPTSLILKSPELCLVEAQINLLVKRAMEKELTLEETKQLDLLIKNKRLLSDEPTTYDGAKKPKREITEAQLITIARKT